MRTRKSSRELIPYLIDARRKGNTGYLQKDKLMVIRKSYEFDVSRENFHI
jgi:hypothetical protein